MFYVIHYKDYFVFQSFKAGPLGLAFYLVLLHNGARSLV